MSTHCDRAALTESSRDSIELGSDNLPPVRLPAAASRRAGHCRARPEAVRRPSACSRNLLHSFSFSSSHRTCSGLGPAPGKVAKSHYARRFWPLHGAASTSFVAMSISFFSEAHLARDSRNLKAIAVSWSVNARADTDDYACAQRCGCGHLGRRRLAGDRVWTCELQIVAMPVAAPSCG